MNHAKQKPELSDGLPGEDHLAARPLSKRFECRDCKILKEHVVESHAPAVE